MTAQCEREVDEIADAIRRAVCRLAAEIMVKPDMLALPAEEQARAMMSGLLTGTICVMLASYGVDRRAACEEQIIKWVPFATQIAMDIRNEGLQ